MNKTIVWILILIVVVVGIVLLSGGKKATETNPITNPAAEQPASLKTADGSIDNAVASVLFEANADVQAPAE
ncbi:MAG: hypothetical protein HY093_01965, partial [Candidatus Liptonbacteria bacterium]|nr:hypothetical protein [Candidatus Liptonbacteria bacterium]